LHKRELMSGLFWIGFFSGASVKARTIQQKERLFWKGGNEIKEKEISFSRREGKKIGEAAE